DCAPRARDGLPDFLRRLDGYLCEIKEAQIRDGLHILGRLPEGGQLVELLLALVRVDNGEVPGLVKALAEDLGLDHRALTADLGAPFAETMRAAGGGPPPPGPRGRPRAPPPRGGGLPRGNRGGG